MFSTILSGAYCGLDSFIVQVEVDVSAGMPGMDMIGALSKEASESRQRIRVALKNNGYSMPVARVTINLSPADRHKSGTAFDLPAAVGLLAATGALSEEKLDNILFLGELGLDGEIKAVRGVLPIVMKAAEMGIDKCVVPKQNEQEAAAVRGITVYGVSHLKQVVCGFQEGMESAGLFPAVYTAEPDMPGTIPDFADLYGQDSAKRALEIAVAGFHHIMMIGPPGSGKTMLARRIPSIMPTLSEKESLEVSAIYSVSGMLQDGKILRMRPFLSPHHTSTPVALIGGGRIPVPGAVSLAHRGILFLDELPEFRKNTIEVLRQPMEDRQVQISRTYGTITYPSEFLLVAAMNPCPCGFYPDMGKCKCSSVEVKRYLGQVSGPILDRIDMCIEVLPLEIGKMREKNKTDDSAKMRERVQRARDIQLERYEGSEIRFNGELDVKGVQKYCKMSNDAEKLLQRIYDKLHLSVRAYHKMIKIARTVADMEGEEIIKECHINEAVYYKLAASQYWKGE